MSANLGETSDSEGMMKIFRGQLLSQGAKEGKSHYILIINFNPVQKNSQYLVSTFYTLGLVQHQAHTRITHFIITKLPCDISMLYM